MHDSSGPQFLCIGQQRSGTSWLATNLRHHPEFVMPPLKELQYFDDLRRCGRPEHVRRYLRSPVLWAKFTYELAAMSASTRRDALSANLRFVRHALRPHLLDAGFSWYSNLFPDRGLSGDVSPSYATLGPAVIADVHRAFPDLRIILLIRHPVARAWAEWNMYVRKGRVEGDPCAVDTVMPFMERRSTRRRSMASQIAANWSRVFPPEQVLIELFDDIVSIPHDVRVRVARFLGASSPESGWHLPATQNRKSVQKSLPLPPEVEDALYDFYATEVDRCASVFPDTAGRWARERAS